MPSKNIKSQLTKGAGISTPHPVRHEKLQWLNDVKDDLIFILDEKNLVQECYEPVWIKDTGLSCARIKGKPLSEVDLPLHVKKILETSVKKVRIAGGVEKVDYAIIAKEKKFLFEAKISQLRFSDGKVSGIIIINRNVTEEKQKEEELTLHLIELEKAKKAMINLLDDMQKEKNKSQQFAKDLEKFKLAVDNVSDLIIITDPDAKILYMNKAVERITGFSEKEVLGKDPADLWGGYMDKEFYEKMWNTIKIQKKTFSGEITNKRKNGEEYISDMQIAPILNSEKNIIFFVAVARDVTKLKEIDKMKSEFVSVVSHQLRTPLTGIKWYTQSLLQNEAGQLTSQQKDFIEEIFNSNERMIKLINDLLNVSHIETGRKFTITRSKIDIMAILKEAISQQLILAKNKGIQIICSPPLTKKTIVFMDPEKIQQVVQSILNNAIKYSFLDKKITIGHKKEKGNFIFFVKDEGMGISTQQQNRIFEKFFRANNILTVDTDGTGLGLYITKAIVEGHGGKIWFQSKENEGTTFFVSLPVNKKDPPSAPETKKYQEPVDKMD